MFFAISSSENAGALTPQKKDSRYITKNIREG